MAFWILGTNHLKGPTMRTDDTGATCTCGHAEGRHSANSTRPCLACTKCDRPGHDPHAAERCRCASFTAASARNRCELCGRAIDDEAIVCHQCALVAPPSITARHTTIGGTTE